jgi:hypothetical protein
MRGTGVIASFIISKAFVFHDNSSYYHQRWIPMRSSLGRRLA